MTGECRADEAPPPLSGLNRIRPRSWKEFSSRSRTRADGCSHATSPVWMEIRLRVDLRAGGGGRRRGFLARSKALRKGDRGADRSPPWLSDSRSLIAMTYLAILWTVKDLRQFYAHLTYRRESSSLASAVCVSDGTSPEGSRSPTIAGFGRCRTTRQLSKIAGELRSRHHAGTRPDSDDTASHHPWRRRSCR